MILDVRNRGFRFGWIGMDAHYGEQPWLRNRLDDEGITYMADIPVTHRIFLEKPNLLIPKRKGNKGKKPTKLKPDTAPLNVKSLSSIFPSHYPYLYSHFFHLSFCFLRYALIGNQNVNGIYGSNVGKILFAKLRMIG